MSVPTLPGDLPGLLRRGLPVVVVGGPYLDLRGVVECQTTGDVGPVVSLTGGPRLPLPCADLALDLSDRIGRVHAAWWWREHCERDEDGHPKDYMSNVFALRALLDQDITPLDIQIDTFRRACLVVAGRAT